MNATGASSASAGTVVTKDGRRINPDTEELHIHGFLNRTPGYNSECATDAPADWPHDKLLYTGEKRTPVVKAGPDSQGNASEVKVLDARLFDGAVGNGYAMLRMAKCSITLNKSTP